MLAPIGVHKLMTFGNAVTENDWIGFFGSYIGAIMGALVAFLITYFQTKRAREDVSKQILEQKEQHKAQLKHEKLLQMIDNRTYLDYTMFSAPILLNDKDQENTIILLHHRIYQFINHNPNEYLNEQKADFVKMDFYGKTDSILDLHINILLHDNRETEVYEGYLYKSGLKKDQSIYIPLFREDERLDCALVKLIATYTTLSNERIKFVSDLLEKKEYYYSIDDNNEVLISERILTNEYYIIPGNPEYL